MGYDFDVIVLGGGPGGYVAAIKAAQLGRNTCLIEQDRVGGVCLNRGCIPTKTMLKSAELMRTMQNAESFALRGIDMGKLNIDMPALQQRKAQVIEQLTGGVEALLKANGVKLINGTAGFLDSHSFVVGDERISSENIVIASGSLPTHLQVPCDPQAKILYSDDALVLNHVPKQMVIIGGGVIGLEFAFLFRSLGSEVTVLEFMNRVVPMLDDDISDAATTTLKQQGIKLLTGAKVVSVYKDRVEYEHNGQIESCLCDNVLIATGRKANLTGYNLEKTSIKTDKKGIITDKYMRTNISHIYAVGDVNGKSMLAHTAFMEGLVAADNICGNTRIMSYDAIPSCIYIQPEIASVGLSESEAKAKGRVVKTGRFPLSANGKALVDGDNSGFIKVIIAADNHQILGTHIFASHATEMIGGIAALMEGEAVADDVIRTVFPHPSVSEIIGEAFHSALDKAIHSL